MDTPPHILAWCAMQKAIEAGDHAAAERHRQDWIRAQTQGPTRNDAAEEFAQEEGGIDWANVASEVNTMLDLNKAANDAWHGQQGAKGRKPQDS
jgi:hypothetical protein